jgi:hypothetical protein
LHTQDFLHGHNIRRDIRAAALSERLFRQSDPTYSLIASIPDAVTATQQFYVAAQDAYSASARSKMSRLEADSHGHHSGEKSHIRADTSPVILPFRETNPAGASGSHNGGSTVSAQARKPPSAAAINVPERFFWGRPHAAVDRARLFREFKTFVQLQLNTGKLKLDTLFVSDMQRLEETLREAGIRDVSSVVKPFVPKLRDALFADMEVHRGEIVDALEQALLSAELPDRLILYHAVARDPQVQSAAALVRNEHVARVAPTIDGNTVHTATFLKQPRALAVYTSYSELLQGPQ